MLYVPTYRAVFLTPTGTAEIRTISLLPIKPKESIQV